MPDFELSSVAQQWINVVLIWVGSVRWPGCSPEPRAWDRALGAVDRGSRHHGHHAGAGCAELGLETADLQSGSVRSDFCRRRRAPFCS